MEGKTHADTVTSEGQPDLRFRNQARTKQIYRDQTTSGLAMGLTQNVGVSWPQGWRCRVKSKSRSQQPRPRI